MINRWLGKSPSSKHNPPCPVTWQETSGPERGFKRRRDGNGGRGATPQLRALGKGDPASHQHEGPRQSRFFHTSVPQAGQLQTPRPSLSAGLPALASSSSILTPGAVCSAGAGAVALRATAAGGSAAPRSQQGAGAGQERGRRLPSSITGSQVTTVRKELENPPFPPALKRSWSLNFSCALASPRRGAGEGRGEGGGRRRGRRREKARREPRPAPRPPLPPRAGFPPPLRLSLC